MQRSYHLNAPFLSLSFFSFFLGLHIRLTDILRLGAKLELQLQAYTIAIAIRDLSCICKHCSSRQCRILNPLSKAGDRTCIFMGTSQVLNLLSHKGTALSLNGGWGGGHLKSGNPPFQMGGAGVTGLPYSDSFSLVSFRLSRNVSSRRSSSSRGTRRREVTRQMRTRARAS